MKSPIRFTAVAALAAGALVLSGCASGSGGSSDGPVELEYWTWAPNVDTVVETWNAENPDIQVEVVEAAGADDMMPKLLAASRAGEGPDLAQAEFQKLPNLVVSDVAADISEYADAFSGEFTDSTLNLVTIGEGIYGVPQDIGPMIFVYRADLFEEYGLTPPTTWDEYADLAREVKEVAPDAFLGGYPDDASTFAAYTQPLGAEWWSTDGESWTIGIDDAASERVAEFWQPLVEDEVVDTTHFFTPEWNTMMNDGTLLSWTAGVWAPGVMESVAPDTAGLWAAAPMPSWDGESEVGLMGGSSVMVTNTSEHPAEAAEFLAWLNGSAEGSSLLASEAGLFPASTAGQESLADLPVPSLVSEQTDFWTFAADVGSNTAPITWGPNVQVAFDAFSDGIKAATASGGSYTDVLESAQDAVVSDLEESGFTVN
ncbi:extracellular solute-binding protein [Marisediminicola sp. LYQ85]|uniref:ABC transporter substrate-binding protein n=1 Tax=Marisediminicola sp. LYQ85 TaxID=3391062 RepID=UPI0039836685